MGDRNPEVVKGVLGSLPSLIGLATQLGSSIPGLKKQKRIKTQQGAAGDVAGGVARAAVGASQTGFGATRGLNLRTGLRQAGQVAKESGGAIARAAGRDEAQSQIIRNERNRRLAKFGGDVADFGANIGQSVVEVRAAREAEIEANRELVAGIPGVPDVGLGGGPIEDIQEVVQQDISEGQAGLDQLRQAREDADLQQGPFPEQGGPALRKTAPIDPLDEALGNPQREMLYGIAPQLELQLRLENFAFDEMDKYGIEIPTLYARIKRMQNLPHVRLLTEQLEAEEF
jgi:hypothetical protein